MLLADNYLDLNHGYTTDAAQTGGITVRYDPTAISESVAGAAFTATTVEGGWECEGVVYRSLSAVAAAITGSHWNGRLFFGLTKRKAAR